MGEEELILKEPSLLRLPPEEEPLSPLWLLVLVLLSGVVLCRFRYLRFKARPDPVEEPPPHEKALKALARMEERPLFTAGDFEAFYVLLAQIVRVFIHERFDVDTRERTTDEIETDLRNVPHLSDGERDRFGSLLLGCDFVKFSGKGSAEARAKEALAEAVALVTALGEEIQ